MKKNYALDLGILTVSEMIEMLQSLSPKYLDWPIYCCGSDECYLCISENEECIIIDMEDLFEEIEELDEVKKKKFPWD